MLTLLQQANSKAQWLAAYGGGTVAQQQTRIQNFFSSETNAITLEEVDALKLKFYYYDTALAVTVLGPCSRVADILAFVIKGVFAAEDCSFFTFLNQTGFGVDSNVVPSLSFWNTLDSALSNITYVVAKNLNKLLSKNSNLTRTLIACFHESALTVTVYTYLYQKTLERIGVEKGMDKIYEKYQALVDDGYEYYDYEDGYLYGTYQDNKLLHDRNLSALDAYKLNKAALAFERESENDSFGLKLSLNLFGTFYKSSNAGMACSLWNISKEPVRNTEEYEELALALYPEFITQLITNIQWERAIAESNFNKPSKAYFRFQLLKSAALFKAFTSKVKGNLRDFQILYVFDQYCQRLSSYASHIESTELESWVQDAESLKGWYDAAKSCSAMLKWFIVECRTSKDKTLTQAELAQYLKDKGFEQMVMLCSADPYATRGGFSYQTFKKLRESLAYFQTTSFKVKSELAILKSALNLCTLFGQDEAALIAKIRSFKADRSLELNLHDLGLFEIRDCRVQDLIVWRPVLIANMELLKYANAHSLENAEPPQQDNSLKQLREKLMITSYENVPASLASHIEHASENGWSQEIMNEFVYLACNKAKQTCIIPSVVVEQGRYQVRMLEPGNPKALYIGELSGCCQHINEGAGNDAAIQSFTDDWCAVLLFENAATGKLLAQSFIWLTQNEKAIVLDSIESVFEESDEIVGSVLVPLLKEYCQKMKQEHDFDAHIANTDYGLTATIRKMLKAQSSVSNVKQWIHAYQNKELGYSDAEDGTFHIKV